MQITNYKCPIITKLMSLTNVTYVTFDNKFNKNLFDPRTPFEPVHDLQLLFSERKAECPFQAPMGRG